MKTKVNPLPLDFESPRKTLPAALVVGLSRVFTFIPPCTCTELLTLSN